MDIPQYNEKTGKYPTPKFKYIYHVFTDGIDEWVRTLKEAYNIIRLWKKDGYYDFRIYKETRWDELNGLFIDEDCIHAIGNFPM